MALWHYVTLFWGFLDFLLVISDTLTSSLTNTCRAPLLRAMCQLELLLASQFELMHGFSKCILRIQEGGVKCIFLNPTLNIMNLNFWRMGAHVSPQIILIILKSESYWYIGEKMRPWHQKPLLSAQF